MPALMPPTWAVLAFMHFAFNVDVVPLVIGGAFAAAAGRGALALASRTVGRRMLTPERRDRLSHLGSVLDAKARWAAPLAMLIYSFGPIPSNQLFIAAGLTRMGLGRIFAAFLAGRLISYPLWIGVAHVAVDRFDQLFTSRLTDVPALVLDIALLALLVAFTRFDWERVLERLEPTPRRDAPTSLRS